MMVKGLIPRLIVVNVLVCITFIMGCDSQTDPATEQLEPPISLLDPHKQPKFIHTLPIPPQIKAAHNSHHTLAIKQGKVWMGLRDKRGEALATTVWGFEFQGKIFSPGPTLIATKHQPITVRWENKLPIGPHLFPVDPTLSIPEINDKGNLPVVIHLHGGHSEAQSDGFPLAWYTQGYAQRGPAFIKKDYYYDNTQEASTLWYHDHTVGMTRLNMYAGLMGFYLVSDDQEKQLIKKNKLPSASETLPLAITDKLFTEDGQLYYPGYHHQPISPAHPIAVKENWPNPSHLDEFFGDFILANGMIWPKLAVKPQVYRFRLLNAADSRSFIFKFDNDMPFYQIMSDGGLLDKPVELTELLLTPAERADILVDFSQQAGAQVILRNIGPDTTFRGYINPTDPNDSSSLVYNKNGERVLSDGHSGIAPPTDAQTTGLIMRFDVSVPAEKLNETSFQPVNTDDMNIGDLSLTTQTSLRNTPQRLRQKEVTHVRKVALFRVDDNDGRELVLLGTPKEGSLFFSDPVTEIIENGTTEIWEIYNTTASGHPMHLHLVQFTILDRQPFEGSTPLKSQRFMHANESIKGATLNIKGFTGNPELPQPNEQGRKDTVVALAGQVTRVIAHFDRPGEYVWHCHIVSHEDYDMMRPFKVVEDAK